jgi:hypothetical protein
MCVHFSKLTIYICPDRNFCEEANPMFLALAACVL